MPCDTANGGWATKIAKRPRRVSELLLQRIREKNARCRLLKQKVVKVLKHTIKLQNGSVLRKFGVAEKQMPASKNFDNKNVPSPPTIADLRKKIEAGNRGPKAEK